MNNPRHILSVIAIIGLLSVAIASRADAAPLASDQVRILGVQLRVWPSSIPGAPKNVPLLLSTSLVDGSGGAVAASGELAGLVVRGDLSGPGVLGVVEIRTVPGVPFEIGTGVSTNPNVLAGPSLLVAGNYVVDNIRLTEPDGTLVVPASPSVVPIKVVDRVIGRRGDVGASGRVEIERPTVATNT